MTDERVLALLRQITDTTALLMSYCDVDEATVHQAVTDSFANVDPAESALTESTRLTLAHRNLFGQMLSYWRNRPDYVDAQGNPLPLSVSGPRPSMETLYWDAAPSAAEDLDFVTPAVAPEILLEHKAVKVDKDGKYVPISYSFRVNTDARTGAMQHLAYFAEFATTAGHNAYKGQGGRFNAVARVHALPADQVPVVQAMLYDKGYVFLTDVDSFLENRKSRSKDKSDLRDVGIGLYYIDQPHGTKT